MSSSLHKTLTPMTQWPAIVVFAALPTVGLVAGPSYAVLIFGLAVVQLAQGVFVNGRSTTVAIDPALCLLAAGFATLCWASMSWSIDPTHSLHGALQVTAIMVGALALLAALPPTYETTDLLLRVLVIATILGATIIVADSLFSYRFEAWVTGRTNVTAATKYNRGIDYLGLIAWPQFAFLALRRRYRETVLLAVCLLAILLIGASLAARVAAVSGVLVFALAFWLPRIVAPLLACSTTVLAAGLPFALRVMANHRAALAPYLKPSGLQRLEIWDYMTARVFEHPLLGWGIAAANAVPVTPAEISSYVFRDTPGTYPHNQWLELWVETGAVGAALGLAFALVVIHRIQRVAAPSRPFAYAAFASAVAVSCVNFELTTDSWWAAMAATSFLFVIISHHIGPR